MKITDVSSVTVEELASTFKASVENIELLKKKKIFKVDEIKSISFSNPTIIGKLTSEGVMQIVANADAVDENLAFGRENLFVVINKKRGENPKLALVFNIGKGTFMFPLNIKIQNLFLIPQQHDFALKSNFVIRNPLKAQNDFLLIIHFLATTYANIHILIILSLEAICPLLCMMQCF